ncbi:MAG: CGNR zinc finger domain-containing protein [Ilumatobacter sp.]|uniref:CGNR zinc finger domain-containing protein n=1 Tax=Ilumatobacter sp. TaxID=1967498 RepID=UPI00391AD39D
MYVASVTESEVRATLETMFDLANLEHGQQGDHGDATGDDPRSVLESAGFSRATEASAASVQRLAQRIESMLPFLRELPDLDIDSAAAKLNAELTEIPITPSIVDHGGVGPHIHWTPPTARFDDQVMADILMALAQEICDNGTIRFGRCGADDCDRLFYDATRNRSKRFCSDPRCASRTHTADHRARRRDT